MSEETLETLCLSAGTVIKVGGIPFRLPADTDVLGLSSNASLAEEWEGPVFKTKEPE